MLIGNVRMRYKTTLFGVIFGFLVAIRLDSPSLHIFIVFMSLFAMIFIENWSYQKMKERTKIRAILEGSIFFVMSLVVASLFIKIES